MVHSPKMLGAISYVRRGTAERRQNAAKAGRNSGVTKTGARFPTKRACFEPPSVRSEVVQRGSLVPTTDTLAPWSNAVFSFGGENELTRAERWSSSSSERPKD